MYTKYNLNITDLQIFNLISVINNVVTVLYR